MLDYGTVPYGTTAERVVGLTNRGDRNLALQVTDVGARFPHRVTYHASCHLLRGLGARQEPKALLQAVQSGL